MASARRGRTTTERRHPGMASHETFDTSKTFADLGLPKKDKSGFANPRERAAVAAGGQ